MTTAPAIYVDAVYIALLVALYLDVRNHGWWPAFRALRIRRIAMALFFAWTAWLLWPAFVSALPDAIGWDQPASARARAAQNPGSWERKVVRRTGLSHPAFPTGQAPTPPLPRRNTGSTDQRPATPTPGVQRRPPSPMQGADQSSRPPHAKGAPP